MAAPINPDVAWAIAEVKGRADALKRRRDYYDGKHLPVIPPANTLSPVLAALLADLADNMCDDVVNETVDRLAIVGWSEPEGTDAALDLTEPTSGPDRGALAQRLWERNRGPAREALTYTDMGWAGDAYNIVEKGKDGVVRWYPQDPRQMAVAYQEDNPDAIRVAARVWLTGTGQGKRWRVNLYYSPGCEPQSGILLERWASRGTTSNDGLPEAKNFTPYVPEPGADGVVDEGARDWTRCPVFHFPAETVGQYGRSVLTPVIPLQDLLNKAIADLIAAMEDTALPQRYGTGIQAKTDPLTGEETPLRRRSRQATEMLTTASTEAEFGQFPGANMAPFMEVITGHRVEIARKGYLPAYAVAASDGSVPSGLSLLVQEGRQVKRCQKWQRGAGWVWREQMAYMLTLSGVPTLPEDLDVEWAPAQTRDEQAQWELAAVKVGLGVPKRQVLIEGGYDPDEVDAWLEDAAAAEGGRVSQAGVGIASVTMPGVPGGMPVPAGAGLVPQGPVAPAGAAQPGLSG